MWGGVSGKSLFRLPEAAMSCRPRLDTACSWGGQHGKPCDRWAQALPCHPPGLDALGGAGRGSSHSGVSGLQSVYERQGIAVMTPTVPGSPKGPFLGLPRGTMRRQKSIGKKHGLHPQRLPPGSQRSPQSPPGRAAPWGPPTGGPFRPPPQTQTFLPAGNDIRPRGPC